MLSLCFKTGCFVNVTSNNTEGCCQSLPDGLNLVKNVCFVTHLYKPVSTFTCENTLWTIWQRHLLGKTNVTRLCFIVAKVHFLMSEYLLGRRTVSGMHLSEGRLSV